MLEKGERSNEQHEVMSDGVEKRLSIECIHAHRGLDGELWHYEHILDLAFSANGALHSQMLVSYLLHLYGIVWRLAQC